MKKRDLYFWEPEINPHTRPLYRELAKRNEIGRVVSITQRREIGTMRRSMGWTVSTADDGVESINAPELDEVERLIRESDPDSVHIFLGMKYPVIVQGQRAAARHGRHFGIMSEPRVLEGAKGIGRLLHSWATESLLRRHAKFVLAIGRHGPAWFRAAGYGRDRVFNFAYFLPAHGAAANGAPAAGAPAKVAFIGRLERMKGVDVLLDAIPLMKSGAEMHFVGTGSLEGEVARRLQALGGGHQHHGVLPIAEIPGFLSGIDILVLPSITKNDGWGAVVSEALFAGAAVVASDRVGASMCVVGNEQGRVVRFGDARQIAAAVDSIVAAQETDARHRALRSRWASSHIDAATGARYFVEIIGHVLGGSRRPASFVADAAAS
ncbi:MAG TPA: glycosyltransferase [Dongiaceae bacterium]|nr:glycosyltransferase [Dongiaceae bacterium]